ncbi:uncharacterized protein MKK02DRAFT_44694 [Dioszegia hungarica]|uniref:Aminoacyl-transfer RNA synthetases class-II family profile domain-containing protein n=1 Tax=Dioszegia hungarica TaxID=4972 RepID=A0AA38HB57_9TREE|nr:uncharacterized protein MKK02DRAFT_44694 [Dioszegia hungarica]KAI9635996.1 hypothetical protein MKK02DRAFT_44694 [Dioszegia hungarica]
MSTRAPSRALRALSGRPVCSSCAAASIRPMVSARIIRAPFGSKKRFNSTTSEIPAGITIRPYVEPVGKKHRAHHGPRDRITHRIPELSLSLSSSGEEVVLAGWLYSQRRASENLHFFTLRDSSGESVQLVCRDKSSAELLMGLPLESVVQVSGAVKAKKQKKAASAAVGSADKPADELEIEVSGAILLNPAEESLPFYPNRLELANEELRAQYRFLDLRRKELANNIKLRSQVAHIARNYFHEQGFTEIETPNLLHPSPEGAREFLVPTRLLTPSGQPTFYALPQSPQQPKQLLVAGGGVEKYYQIARCFRDEDGRKDRQPEFTQIDLEMGFVDGAAASGAAGRGGSGTWGIGGGQVRDVVEGLIRQVWREVKGMELEEFRVMPYEVAMDVYGSDKPDTRFEMYTLPIGYYPTLSDESLDKILLDESQYTVEWMVTAGEYAKQVDIPSLIGTNNFIQQIAITEENVHSWLADTPLLSSKGLSIDPSLPGGPNPGDVIFLAQRKKIAEGGWTQLGRLRVQMLEHLINKGSIIPPPKPHFLWVTQFPLFTLADPDKEHLSKGRYAATHHPFTAPMFEDLADLKAGKVDKVRGQHYDLVLDGQEVGGGSVRVHDAGLQEYILKEVLQLNEDEVSRFAHLLQALKFGAPPHAGLAIGFDRLVAILAGAKSIREVIAFPKTGAGYDPVFKSPREAEEGVLKDYGLSAIADKEGRTAGGQ